MPSTEMLTAEKHCEILDTNIREKIATIYSSYKLFVQLFSGIVGGSVALALQYGESLPFALLSSALAALVVFTCRSMILDSHDSWFRFREKLRTVAGTEADIPPPVSA